MNNRNEKIVECALGLFARYGIGKTTMNDIAREAGVARQTLYNAYPNKEAVLRATVRFSALKTFDAVESAWADQTTISEKIETFFENAPLYWYDLIQASPDVAELIDGIHTTANDELIEIAKLWNEKITVLILEHAQPGSFASDNPADLADFIYSASLNAKYNAPDRAVLVRRLNLLKISVLGLFD